MNSSYNKHSGLKRKTKRRLRALLTGAGAVVLFCLLAIFTTYALKNMGKMPQLTNAPEATTQAETTSQETVRLSGSADFLLACVTQEKEISFAFILHAELEERLFTLRMLPADASASVDGVTGTLSAHYSSGGGERLVKAVENASGAAIDRYATVTEMNFVKMIKLLGSVEIYIENAVSIDNENASINLEKGLRKLDYNSLLDYIKYSAQGNALLDVQAEAMCCIFESYFKSSNISKGETLFSELINLVKSDVSARDYISNQSLLAELASANVNFVAGSALYF